MDYDRLNLILIFKRSSSVSAGIYTFSIHIHKHQAIGEKKKGRLFGCAYNQDLNVVLNCTFRRGGAFSSFTQVCISFFYNVYLFYR